MAAKKGQDAWGRRLGTTAAKMDAAIMKAGKRGITVSELTEIALADERIEGYARRHCWTLRDQGFVIELGEDRYAVNPNRAANANNRINTASGKAAKRATGKASKRGLNVNSEVVPLPEEVDAAGLPQGAVRTITVNAYERNPKARRRCIDHYGAVCSICEFNFGARYGSEAEGYIHVHHVRPLSEIGGEYEVDPVEDLRPVCPNCHAVFHLGGRCRSIDEVRQMLK